MLTRLRALLPNDYWCRTLLVPVIVFVATAMDRHYLTDFWHHLARGRAMVEQGQIVNRDLFTFTVADEPFQDNNWLTQLLYYGLYQAGGLNLVVFVNSLVLSVTFGVLVWLCRRVSQSSFLASALGGLVFLGMWQVLIIRPQTFSFLLFVVLYAVLLAAERRPWLLMAAPPILALWSNVHGGFPIGLVLTGAFLAAAVIQSWTADRHKVLRDRRVWALAVCLLGCFLATFINPYDWNIYRYVLTTSSRAAGRRIDEWVPPDLHLFIGKVFVFSLLGVIAAFGLARRRPTVRDICIALCFLPLAIGSLRMVAWWLYALAPILAGLLASKHETEQQGEEAIEPTFGAVGYCAVLLVAAILSLPWLERVNPLNVIRGTHRDEMDLEQVVESLPQGSHRIFSRFEWGEFLGWRTGPADRVFMDGRIEIYPDEVWSEYMTITTGADGWQTILDRYQVDCLILDASYHENLIAKVHVCAGWRETEAVGNAVVFQRADSRDTVETASAVVGPGH